MRINTMLNKDQLDVINSLALDINVQEVEDFSLSETEYSSLTDTMLLNFLKVANALYRSGYPCISDEVYDSARNEFKKKQPDHPFITEVEPEHAFLSKTVRLPKKMLSTDKAYSKSEIESWVARIEKAALAVGVSHDDISIKVTAKLDGYAAYDDGKVLYTRGNGESGQDISRVFDRGLKVGGRGERGLGAGEIVLKKEYFKEHLSQFFENSRNIQASIIAEKNIDENVLKAIEVGAALFYPFSELKPWEGSVDLFLSDFDLIISSIWDGSEFDVDGVVIETTNEEIKVEMGATRHHHRWQTAFKVNVEKAEVVVRSVRPQTARTGRITPVVELEPTRLSGALISRATAHNYGMVKSKGIGANAKILLVRSGLVIPKIEEVLEPSDPDIPDACPSCGAAAVWDGDNLVCPNSTDCIAQAENTIIHFFKTLGNIDGFGPATISTLYFNGIRTIHDVYSLTEEQLEGMGYKEKTRKNLLSQLQASKALPIEDWRFLAAFGVVRLALGSSEKFLQHHKIESIFDASISSLSDVDGFADKTASAIVGGLHSIRAEFEAIYSLGFNLERTELLSESTKKDSPIAGKSIVFTGSMQFGKRPDMAKQAKLLGASVSTAVSSKTDFLVTGEKVGKTKIVGARELGVKLLTEKEYIELIN